MPCDRPWEDSKFDADLFTTGTDESTPGNVIGWLPVAVGAENIPPLHQLKQLLQLYCIPTNVLVYEILLIMLLRIYKCFVPMINGTAAE